MLRAIILFSFRFYETFRRYIHCIYYLNVSLLISASVGSAVVRGNVRGAGWSSSDANSIRAVVVASNEFSFRTVMIVALLLMLVKV